MKKIIFATAVAMISFFSCTKVSELENTSNPLPMPENVAVSAQGVEVTPKTNYVVVGEAVTLTASFKPEEAQVGTVSWKSSDETVATVDASGKVTTLAVGVAHITATVDGVSASSLVNVFAERIPATEIKLSKEEVNLLVGRAANIKSGLMPENTTDRRNIEWSSSNENVAVVSYGYIQAKGIGEATVTARQGDLTATVKVTVADKIKLVDRSEAWTITDTPKWDKNWSGKITGSHEEVSVAGFDGEYAWFGVIDASKFEGVEAVSNAVYEQVTDKKDAGEDPKDLFSTGESFSKSYSDKGEAVAYLLAYDSEFEFTGEYVVYNFTAREPDPVHATGIQFSGQSGWDYAPISSLQIKEGKSTRIQVSLLPEDCTDTGSITLEAADPSMLNITAYYPQWYENQFTISALAAGTTKIIAKFNNVVSELEVTITGTDITWTDKSSAWTGQWGMGMMWGYYECFGFTLNSCTSQSHLIVIVDASEISGDPAAYYKTVASQNEGSYNISSDMPDFMAQSWNDKDETKERYAYVFGIASGEYDGNYAIFHYDPNGGSGDNPGGGEDPVSGKMISMSGNYFSVIWEDEYKSLDEVTMEGWVYGDSFSGNASGNDGLASMMGVEGVFLIRLQNGKPEVVYGGAKKANGEYEEKKVTCTTTLADKEWHHLAATYARNGNVILYIDGVEAGRNTAEDHGIDMNGVGAGWAGGGLADWHFYIGVSCQTSRDFDGSLAYLRVWDSARTASEISDNMSKAEPVDNGYNLLANWYFNEGTGNKVTDQSGYGYDITAHGDVTWVEGTLPF